MNAIPMVTITQDLARELLNRSAPGRGLSRDKVRQYARDMAEGKWVPYLVTPIFIDDTGAVINGRHRLTALLSLPEGSTLDTPFIGAIPTEYIHVIDTGLGRTVTHTLQMSQIPNAKYLSALWFTSLHWATGANHRGRSRSEEVEWILANPNAEKAAAFAKTQDKNSVFGRLPIGTMATLWDVACYGAGSDTVEEYVDLFKTGKGGDFTLPLSAALRGNGRQKLNSYDKALIVARAYTAWVKGETLSKLYATRRQLANLPGFNDWMEANWEEENE